MFFLEESLTSIGQAPFQDHLSHEKINPPTFINFYIETGLSFHQARKINYEKGAHCHET